MNASTDKKPLQVVVVTGGHEFDASPFAALFEGHPDLRLVFADQKDGSELFEDVSGWTYDVIVFYNMGQKISEKRQANLLALLDKGVGVVGLHHCIVAYASWPEWARIMGGRYFEKSAEFDGVTHGASIYQHDVPRHIVVADRDHAVTAGLSDFNILDETYKHQWIDPNVHVLLTDDDSTSDRPVAWTTQYRNARVCYIQPGHGPSAYHDSNYRTLVAQAIRWAAK